MLPFLRCKYAGSAPRTDPRDARRRRALPPGRIPRLPTAPAIAVLLLWLAGPAGVPPPARAEEPMLVIVKNTLYGSLTGLVLGGALTLVVDKDERDDVVRWGVVIGTFGGFAYGVYSAHSGRDDLLGMRKRKEEIPRLRSAAGGPLAWRLHLQPVARRTGADEDELRKPFMDHDGRD